MAAIRTPKIADAIATHIEKLILEGALRPGEKLAAERELAQKLGVSRPSIREGIEKLVLRGLLRSTHSGTFVAEFLSPAIAPLANLYRDNHQAFADYFEFREAVEARAAREAAIRITSVEKLELQKRLSEMRKAHKIEDPTQEAEADVNLHMTVYEAGHNVVVLHIMRALSELLRNNIFFNRKNLYLRPGVREKLLAQHVEIGEAVLSGNPNRAERAAGDHIRYVFDTVEEIQLENKRISSSLIRTTRNDFIAN
ncbi:FCD domain-containing protein [Hyphomicrobium sp.]|uniref:FCD domain-containing protein n=1 Tax=Hyphomicrobium sp. TaxID=82 RepID=UPI0025C390DE|nr:FCD domain-containing protein [Hyphomicrobium sp.]